MACCAMVAERDRRTACWFTAITICLNRCCGSKSIPPDQRVCSTQSSPQRTPITSILIGQATSLGSPRFEQPDGVRDFFCAVPFTRCPKPALTRLPLRERLALERRQVLIHEGPSHPYARYIQSHWCGICIWYSPNLAWWPNPPIVEVMAIQAPLRDDD